MRSLRLAENHLSALREFGLSSLDLSPRSLTVLLGKKDSIGPKVEIEKRVEQALNVKIELHVTGTAQKSNAMAPR